MVARRNEQIYAPNAVNDTSFRPTAALNVAVSEQ